MNSEVIKFVAGGGKTTHSENVLKQYKNGLYLAFTNSVVKDLSEKGYLCKTIDSLFTSFIIPKFTTFIPLIANGSKIEYIESADLPNHMKGIANIRIDSEGNLYNLSKKLSINISTLNVDLDNCTSEKSIGFIKYIFGKKELRLTNEFRGELSNYLLKNYSDIIIKLLESRFSYIIIDEAQDLKKYREEFAKILYDSNIRLILLGDENQNINAGGIWFEGLPPTQSKKNSFRCPENNCKWIRENLKIEIYGNSNKSEFKHIDDSEILNYDDGNRTLLYNAKLGKNKEIIELWHGEKDTIKSAKGSTIDNDIVIIGNSLNKRNYYTAITRTRGNVYTSVKKIG